MFKIIQKWLVFLVMGCMAIQATEDQKQPVPVHIRLAMIEDIPACIAIARNVHLNVFQELAPRSDEELQVIFDLYEQSSDPFHRDMSQLLVAETESKEIVGCMMVYPFSHPHTFQTIQSSVDLDFEAIRQQVGDSMAYVSRLYIDESYRGGGIGKKLLQSIMDFFPHTQKIYLDTFASNKNAIGFYTHLGFVKEEFGGFYNGKYEFVVLSIDTNRLTSNKYQKNQEYTD